jgi:hypothetical protein
MDFAADDYLSEAHIPPTVHTVHVYTIYLYTQGRGGEVRIEPERRLEVQQFTNLGRKNTTMTDCISSL